MPTEKPIRIDEEKRKIEPFKKFALEKEAHLGNVALAYATWGNPIIKEEFKKHHLHHLSEEKRANLAEFIDGSGFSGGYSYPKDVNITSEAVQEQQVDHAVMLIRKLLDMREWKAVDQLIISSASSSPKIIDEVRAKLEEEGVTIGEMQFYGLYCAGASAAFIDSLRDYDPALQNQQDKKTITIGIESLGGKQSSKQPEVNWLFGNAASGIAYIPGEEIEHICGETRIDQDTEGVISLPKAFDLPDSSQQLPPPPWYSFGEGAQNIFARTLRGAFLVLTKSSKFASMEVSKTFKYFKRRATPIILNTLKKYYEKFTEIYGALGESCSHHPSLGVLEGLNHGLDKECEKMGIPKPPINWQMEGLGINNVSAATFFVVMTKMIEDKKINFNIPFMALGLGIGSTIHTDIIRFIQ